MSFLSFFRRKKTVLIVEDDGVLRATLEERFTRGSFKTYVAGDPREVLILMNRLKPDALVLDLILPLKDGITLLEEIRREGYEKPVFLLTNLLGSEPLRDDARRLHASFFNKTSTSPDELVRVVTETLNT